MTLYPRLKPRTPRTPRIIAATFLVGLITWGLLSTPTRAEEKPAKAVAPKAVAPKAVTPKAVAPKAVAPKAVAPKAVAPKAVAPKTSATKPAWQVKQKSYAAGLSAMVGITGRQMPEQIAVQVLRQGKPVAGQTVEFRITATPNKAKGTKLSASRVVTDAKGMAKVKLTVGDAEGQYVVSAFLQGSVTAAKPVVTKVSALTPMWIMFLVIGLLGGLGLFLYGMTLAGDHLQAAFGEQMRVLINKLARNRFTGVLFGTMASAVLQSSSAATVMLVGFVSATMMTLTQAIAVTMGTKIGVTITAQLIAFNISKYALAIVGTGVVIMLAAGKKEKMKHVGAILLGFGLLFFGLATMSGAMKPLRGVPEFAGILLQVGSSVGLGILIGMLFTAIIQSSAATVAICMALAVQGLLPLETALPIAVGSTVGTCATALLASLGTNRDGKRVAVSHLIFAVSAALVSWPVMGPFCDVTRWVTDLMGSTSPARAIANGYMLFAIVTALLFLPLVSTIEWLTRKILPTSKEEVVFGPKYLNEASLTMPVLALDQAQKELERMAGIFNASVKSSIPAILDAQKEKIDELMGEEDKINILERAIRPYLSQVARRGLSEDATRRERLLIYITEHYEEAGDQLAKQLLQSGADLVESGDKIPEDGAADLRRFHEKIVTKSETILEALISSDRVAAERVIQLSFKETQLARKLREAQLDRMHSEESVKSSREMLAILAGLVALGGKLNEIADELIREV